MEKGGSEKKHPSLTDFPSSHPQAHIFNRKLGGSVSVLFRYKSKGKGNHRPRYSMHISKCWKGGVMVDKRTQSLNRVATRSEEER